MPGTVLRRLGQSAQPASRSPPNLSPRNHECKAPNSDSTHAGPAAPLPLLRLIAQTSWPVFGVELTHFMQNYKNESIEFMVLKSIWNSYYFGDNLREEMEQEEREYRKNKKRYLYEKYYWAYKK